MVLSFFHEDQLSKIHLKKSTLIKLLGNFLFLSAFLEYSSVSLSNNTFLLRKHVLP